MKPDLGDEAARASYRRELRKVAFGWRLLGLVLVALGGVGLLVDRFEGLNPPSRTASWGLLALGWLILIFVVVHRTRYHKRRMAEL